jgi:hypothetical protein
MAPTLQKNLKISFALYDGDGGFDYLTLPINPEDLTRAEPSRVSVVNAMDGAWVDSFGRGLSTITISGHTGWGQNNRPDGVVQFTRLRDDFIHRWHERRQNRIDLGQDPDLVRLILVDPLNGNYVADVVPMQFTLRRSKSQPLLLLYNLSLTVTNDKASAPPPINQYEDFFGAPGTPSPVLAINSIGSSVAFLQGIQGSLAKSLKDVGLFGQQVRAVTAETFLPAVTLANEVIKTANDTRAVISASAQVAVNLASDLSGVASKVWSAVGAVANLPAQAKAEVMRVRGAFSNLNCVLSNGFANATSSPTSYSDLYGASNCSSTSGGRPASASVLAGTNPFDQTGMASSVYVSPQALSAIKSAKVLDLVPAINQAQVTNLLSQINAGVSWPQ